MASASDDPTERDWSDLEQGFFASAPPETPGPPAEPLRFDDLDPAPLPRPTLLARLRDVRTAAAAVASSARRRASTLGRRARPALRRALRRLRAATVIARRRARPALGLAREALARLSSIAGARLRAWLPADRPDLGAIASAIVSVLFVMGLSAAVVASRGNGRTNPSMLVARIPAGAIQATIAGGIPMVPAGPAAERPDLPAQPEAAMWGPPPQRTTEVRAADARPAVRAAAGASHAHKTSKRSHRSPPAARAPDRRPHSLR